MSAVLGWDAHGLTAAAPFLKMFTVILAQGRVRIRNRAYVHLEDAAFFGRGPSPVAEDDTMRSIE